MSKIKGHEEHLETAIQALIRVSLTHGFGIFKIKYMMTFFLAPYWKTTMLWVFTSSIFICVFYFEQRNKSFKHIDLKMHYYFVGSPWTLDLAWEYFPLCSHLQVKKLRNLFGWTHFFFVKVKILPPAHLTHIAWLYMILHIY